MARYIDADALYEKTAEWEASALAYIEGERSAFKHDVADAPTVDAVEVVRCKECKFYNEDEMMCNDTNGFDRYWKPTDFCSYGERREDG